MGGNNIKRIKMMILTVMVAFSILAMMPDAIATVVVPTPEPDLLWENTDSYGDVTDVATGKLAGRTDVAFIDNMIVDTVFAVYGNNGTVHWLNYSFSGYSIAVGDVDGDGKNEVIAGGQKENVILPPAIQTSGISGIPGIAVFEDDGTLKFFYPTNSEFVKDIELGDVDGDGVDDIVACNNIVGARVYAFNGINGSNIAGWPVDFGAEQIQDIALGNLDGSGGKDVAMLSNSTPGTLYVYNSTGARLWFNNTVLGRSVEIGNVDSDSENEVVIGDQQSNHVYVYDGDTNTLEYSYYTNHAPSEVELGDLDGDSKDEIAVIIGYTYDTTIFAIDINATDQVNEMWNYEMDWTPQYYGEGLAIGDVDRDYENEVIAASDPVGLSHPVYAFDGMDSNGDNIGDVVWMYDNITGNINDVEVGDVDDDGDMDVVVGTSGGKSVYALATQEHTVQVNGNTIYFDSDPSNITDLTSPPMPPNPPPGYNFPYGVFSINITVLTPGQNATITITLPENLSSNAVYWKYSPNGNGSTTGLPGWYQVPLGDNDGDNVITITLRDGGIGDADGVENRIIIDDGGPALPSAKVPALAPIGIMALAGLLSLIAAVSIRWRKP